MFTQVVCYRVTVARQVSRQFSEVLLCMEEDEVTHQPHRQAR